MQKIATGALTPLICLKQTVGPSKCTYADSRLVNISPRPSLWLRRLVADPSYRPKFDAGSAHVRLLAKIVISGQVSPSTSVCPVSIIPPMLHTHSFIYHPRCIMFFSQYFSFPCQYHSTNASYSSIHLPPTLYNVFLPVLQISPVSIVPPLLHTHSFIYHSRCIMFFSQYSNFPLSVSFHHCSILSLHVSLTLQLVPSD